MGCSFVPAFAIETLDMTVTFTIPQPSNSLHFLALVDKIQHLFKKDGSRFGYLDVSRGHLHLAVISPCRTKFDVYEMKRDYSGWFLKYHVDLEAIAISFPDMITICVDPPDLHYYKFAILGIIREADDGESYLVLHIPGKASTL
ncbi:hypothetical protein Dsin_015109 [Dipteronia sinensis]|uniref:Uncharacterized protein n=1 Tax=Dipteronia sinensis TaxID=43782 RepID=A0AAE0EAP0_9ROSI|nr:hypothetical protein Dsin_015109 [Dipteronia sinensis]